MGRQLRPLDPADGPTERFACELRALRAWAGDLPFWKMARRCSISKSALAAAVAGYQIPSERVTQEFVRVCGGDWALWRDRRLQAIADLGAAPGDDRHGDRADGHGLVLARPGWLVPFHDQHPVRYRSSGDGVGYPADWPPRRPPGRSRLRGVALVALAALTLALPAGWIIGRSSAPRPVTRAAAAAAQQPTRLLADGQDPYIGGCGKDQTPLERQPIYRTDGAFYGWVVLFFSARCDAAWGYVLGPNSPRWTVHVRAWRMTDNVTADSSFRGQARPNSWGNALSVGTGCVRAEAWIDTGPHAVTSCWSPAGPVSYPAYAQPPVPAPVPASKARRGTAATARSG